MDTYGNIRKSNNTLLFLGETTMKFDCKIKVKHNYKKLNTVIQKLPQTTKESIENILKNIRGYAIKLEKRS